MNDLTCALRFSSSIEERIKEPALNDSRMGEELR